MPQVVEFISSQTALGRVGESDDIGGAIARICRNEEGKCAENRGVQSHVYLIDML